MCNACVQARGRTNWGLRLLLHPKTRDQSHLSDVVHVEATGLGSWNVGYPEKWDISIRSD